MSRRGGRKFGDVPSYGDINRGQYADYDATDCYVSSIARGECEGGGDGMTSHQKTRAKRGRGGDGGQFFAIKRPTVGDANL